MVVDNDVKEPERHQLTIEARQGVETAVRVSNMKEEGDRGDRPFSAFLAVAAMWEYRC